MGIILINSLPGKGTWSVLQRASGRCKLVAFLVQSTPVTWIKWAALVGTVERPVVRGPVVPLETKRGCWSGRYLPDTAANAGGTTSSPLVLHGEGALTILPSIR